MSVTVMTLKPGRYQDFLEQHARAEALLTKCGAKNVRLIAALAAGQASGSLASTWEADDWAQHGQVMQAFFSGGGAELMASDVGSETSPIASWQSSTYVDIPR